MKINVTIESKDYKYEFIDGDVLIENIILVE